MPVTGRSLRLQAQLERQLQHVTDQQTRDLTVAWVRAWDETAPDLQDAIDELLAQQTAGVVAKALVTRNTRLLYALDQIGRNLTTLASQAGVRILGDVRQIVQDAADRQAAIIGAQLPDIAPGLPSLVNAATIDAIVGRTATQITNATYVLAPDAYDAVQRELLRGVVIGANPRHTADRIIARTETAFNGGLMRALVISRTETIDAHRAGAAAGQAAHADVLTGWVWNTHLSERTCPACLSMNGRVFPLSEPGPHGHQNCVLPGAVVSGPRALASTTRWFEGEVVDIETVDGRRLSVTPNHPILTPHGWVPAGLLREGDDVVGGSVGESPSGGRRPDDHQVPALIEDVAQTLGGATSVQAVRVPTAAEDFHGDGAGSDVHVVRTHRLLRDDVQPTLAELPGQPSFMIGDMGLESFAGEGGLGLLLDRFLPTADGIMRGERVAPVLLGGPSEHHGAVGLNHAANGHTCGLQAVADGGARDAVRLCERLDGLASFVSLDDLFGRQRALGQHGGRRTAGASLMGRDAITPKATVNQNALESSLAYPMPSRDSLAAFAGDVVTDRILHIGRRSWSGHVYNLQTDTGWFLANGILTHNCRCSRTPVTKTWADLGYDLPEPAGKQPTQAATRAWFNSLPEHEQLAIMGPQRLALLRGHRIGWDDLASLKSTPGWRDSWQITPVRDLAAGRVPQPA